MDYRFRVRWVGLRIVHFADGRVKRERLLRFGRVLTLDDLVPGLAEVLALPAQPAVATPKPRRGRPRKDAPAPRKPKATPSPPPPPEGPTAFDDPELLRYTQRCAYFKARELWGKYGFTEEDLRDLEQELLLRAWQQRYFYKAGRGKWSTFLNNVFANHLANIIAHRRAKCRDYRKVVQIG